MLFLDKQFFIKMLTLLLMPMVLAVSADDCPTPTRVSEKVHQQLLQSQLQFSFDLLQTVGKQRSSENVFFSPSSIYNALLITYFSSGGSTEQTLRSILRIPVDQFKQNVIGDYLKSKPSSQGVRCKKYELRNANRIYLSTEYKVRDCMKKLFAEEFRPADFTYDPAGVRKQINSWVSKQTKTMIPELFPYGSLLFASKLVLVNAAYFKGNWMSKFKKANTHKSKFHLANGSAVPVTMMMQDSAFAYREFRKQGVKVLDLPYEGGDISMLLLLPFDDSASAIPDLLNKLTVQTLLDVIGKMSQSKPMSLDVYIPKFTVQLEYDLKEILKPMGAGALFDNSADFSTLAEKAKGLRISKAIHKAKIKVDEKGTEAAAATGLGSFYSASLPNFNADQPFIYIIYVKASKQLLFTGIFNSP